MPRLIHLNGPPGIGKSTVAQMYVDEHAGVLNLDIDELRRLVGGSRDRFGEAGELVRPLALAMAATHLQSGRDVVLPQYLGRVSEIERFENVAHRNGAKFCEVVLMDTKESAIGRFVRRSEAGALPWHREVAAAVGRAGGLSLLDQMYDQLMSALPSRPYAVVVTSTEGLVQQTYDAVLPVLSPSTHPAPPRGVAVVVDGGRVLVIKRHLKGRDYAVLPGGGIEAGETAEQTAVRELLEETTLEAAVDRCLWHFDHSDREASYFLMRDVRGTPVLSGDEAEEHAPDNSFVLTWATPDELAALNLYPEVLRDRLAELLHQ